MTIAAPRAAAASRSAGATITQPALRVGELRLRSAGWRGSEIADGVAPIRAAPMRVDRAAPGRRSVRRRALRRSRRARHRSRRPQPLLGALGVERLDHLVGDVDACGLDEDGLLQDQVVLLGLEDLLDDLLARSTTAASSSFLRWFRSSWNSRRLRWSSRSWSTSSRWRRVALGLGRASARPCRACRPRP